MIRACLLLSLLSLLSCLGCSNDSPPASSQEPDGPKLFVSKNCSTCHGPKHEGTFMAPPLAKLNLHWNAADLAGFLKEPNVWKEKTPRLAEHAKHFRSPMPPMFGTDEERRILAEWLLTLP